MSEIKDPIVIEPTGIDLAAEWTDCGEYAKHVFTSEGEVNWWAAFGADPGCCTCPNCHQYFWSWGTLIECTECHFRFQTDWWSMYAWGVSAGRGGRLSERLHAERLAHPYYRYGFEHPVEDAWKEHDKIDWKTVLA